MSKVSLGFNIKGRARGTIRWGVRGNLRGIALYSKDKAVRLRAVMVAVRRLISAESPGRKRPTTRHNAG